MTTMTIPGASRARRHFLAASGSARGASLLLIGDAVAAIGFAGGLAGAIAALAEGGRLWPWLLLTIASGGLRPACAAGAFALGARAATRTAVTLRDRMLGVVMRQPAGGAPMNGALATAAIDEVAAVGGHVARFVPARQAAIVSPLLVLGAVAVASPVAALILVGTLVPFVAAMILAGGAAGDKSRRQFAAMARLSGLFADRLHALPLLLAYRAGDRERERLTQAADEVADRTLSVLKVAFLSTGSLEFFAALSVALVAVYAGFNLLGLLPFAPPERLDLARAFLVLALAPEFYVPMRRLAAAYHDKQAAETAADRLMALEAAQVAPAPAALTHPPALALRAVAIRYPGSDVDAVAPIDLTVPAGRIVALVGPSGSGKSSLLHALLGLAPLSGGRIEIDGRPLASCEGIAGGVAWAGQTPLLIPGSIADNIALARPDARAADIARAAHAAGLGAMLARRPAGLGEVLDPRGGGLSGGERRRIGIARALLKDAPLLLLDEPTAHLDPAAEHALIATLRTACRDRTVLMATHSDRLCALAHHVVDLGAPR